MFVLSLAGALWAQMPDSQVIELIRQYSERGMGQSEITAELMRRGVTQQQLLRIHSGATRGSGAGLGTSSTSSSGTGEETDSRLRTLPWEGNDGRTARTTGGMGGVQQTGAVQGDITDPRAALRPDGRGVGEADVRGFLDTMLMEAERARKTPIFGHNVFAGKELTFEPSLNIATPENYLLGPGDEVIIDIWGEAEQTIRRTVSPDGEITINRLGPVALAGFTVREADARLRRTLAGIYSSAEGDAPGTFIKLSLGRIRSIQVHVMGEVENPGTYTLPSLASLFHVLYLAGGVNDIGSLREISVSRAGERIATVDVYSYLLEGRSDVDIALKDGDVVVVPPYRNLVEVAGKVKRPMKYEMKGGQTLGTLIDYSGGFAGDAYKDAVTVVRHSGGRMRQVHDVRREGFARFTLADGDSIAVGGVIDRFENRLEITGAVFRPGLYSASDSVVTVRSLIRRAEGTMGDAFTARAVLTREKADYTLEVVPLDVGAIMAEIAPDVEMRNGDVLHIPSIFELREEYTVTIQGEVRNPGQYAYADNLSIEDMIIAAGGLLESASTMKADVYRRIKKPSSMFESEARSESYTLPIRSGLEVERGGGWSTAGDGRTGGIAGSGSTAGDGSFTLKPFDVVTIRTSPGYEKQKPVAVLGEVLFPGVYALVGREERLSDLVNKSGGALSTAYLKGAKLVRKKDEDEQTRAQSVLKLTQIGGLDSISLANLNVDVNYSVGIELDKALAYPGSDYDLVLTEGDVLFVPQYVGTVAISGAVLFPNTVSYREGANISDYIDQAGGYAHRARRRAKIVVYMNGTIARVKSMDKTKITPGCEIVVPYKSYRSGSRLPLSEIISAGALTTSAASLVTSIVNQMK